MDLSGFSEENFDVKNWLNAAFTQGRAPEESIEQHASTLVIKLQMQYIELSNSLEEASNQALITVPKSIREIEKIRKEGSELKKKIDWFNEHLSKVEANTVDSLKFIAELDKIKIRMEKVQNALKQAEKVSKLGDNIEAIFSSNNFQQIADRIFQMQLSLQILKDVKEFSKEQRNLEKLQDRLEGMTRPYLLQAFNQYDVDAALQFVDIFTKINRTPQLLEYYYRCRQVPVEQHWTSFDKQQASQASPSSPRKLELNFDAMKENPFVKWLPSFYEQVLLLTNKEVTWSQKVFSKEHQVIPSLIFQTLSSFTPQFKKRIETFILHENNKQFLEHIISLHSITASFSRTILGVVGNADPQMIGKVKNGIFEPYFQYQHDYSTLEKKYLLRELEKIKPSKSVFSKTISNIENSMSRLFLAGEHAIERCIQFTYGSESEGLVKTLNDYFMEFIQHLYTLLQSLREQAHLDVLSKDNRFDWSNFGGALSLLQIVSKLTQRLNAFDRLVKSHVVSQKSTLFSKNGGETTVSVPHFRNHADKSKRLISFFSNLEDVTFKLLVAPSNLLNSYNQAVHSFVYDTVFVFVKDKLSNVNTLEVWVQEPQVSPLNLPTFSLSPSPYINQIGEHLLTLPQQLEPFSNQSNSESSLFDNQVFDDNNSIKDRSVDEIEGVDTFESPQKSESNEDEEENKFAFQWINSVGRGTMTLYIQKVLEIPVLSDLGTSQLIVDIGYLINVLSALGVSIDLDLEVVLKYLNAKTKNDFIGVPDSEQRIASILSQKRGMK